VSIASQLGCGGRRLAREEPSESQIDQVDGSAGLDDPEGHGRSDQESRQPERRRGHVDEAADLDAQRTAGPGVRRSARAAAKKSFSCGHSGIRASPFRLSIFVPSRAKMVRTKNVSKRRADLGPMESFPVVQRFPCCLCSDPPGTADTSRTARRSPLSGTKEPRV
jgi:hypothetical protein